MNKAKLIEEISGKTGLAKKETRNVVDAVTETIIDTTTKGEKVTLVGFGTFQAMERKAGRMERQVRSGVNPLTKGAIQVPAKKVLKFSPGKRLREKVG